MASTGYKVFPYQGFGGGLNLRDGIDVVKQDQAIDALNVLFTTRGAVEQRSGYAQLTSVEGTNRYDSLSAFYTSAGVKQIVAGAGGRVEGISAAGAVVASVTDSGGPHYFQRFGGPTGEHLYVANGTDILQRWTGSAFSTPTYVGFQPDGKYLGLSMTDNRLVNARFSGTVAGDNPSTVRFSDEGDPLSWDNTNYVDLTPGDGEEIMGIASWRDLVLVFKQSRFFVFYGNSTDDDGNPKFNYRPVDAGVGLVTPGGIAVSEQGVYFLARNGIYFTTGAQPELISDLVGPIFTGTPSIYYTGGTLNDGALDKVTMAYHANRLFMSFPSATAAINDKQLVFDPHEKWWTMFNLPAGPMVNFRPGPNEELVFGYSSGLKHLGRWIEGTYTADAMDQSGAGGVAIDAHWQGGWFNYETQAVKTIREAVISGTGLVTVQYFRDYRLSPARSVTKELSPPVGLYDTGLLYDAAGLIYGPSSIIQPKPIRKAIRGETFSLRFSNAVLNRSFRVHRFSAHIREVLVPSRIKVR